jgi:EpsI family protein
VLAAAAVDRAAPDRMGARVMTKRLLVLSALFAVALAMLVRLEGRGVLVPRSIAGLPMDIDGWSASPDVLFDPDVERVLGADSYVNRVYTLDGSSIDLYVGYHHDQTGAPIHSPLNCLPGSGWQPIARSRVPLSGGRTVNLVKIQKGAEQQMVAYWYQTPRRVTASEYAGKAYLALDALTDGRTDAALVRIIKPIVSATPEGERTTAEAVLQFARLIEPRIHRQLFQ